MTSHQIQLHSDNTPWIKIYNSNNTAHQIQSQKEELRIIKIETAKVILEALFSI